MTLQRLKEQEDQLCDSKFDLEYDIFEKLGSLIQAKWDSNSLKFDLSKMLSEHEKRGKSIWHSPLYRLSLEFMH